jgi:hypothetical protein
MGISNWGLHVNGLKFSAVQKYIVFQYNKSQPSILNQKSYYIFKKINIKWSLFLIQDRTVENHYNNTQ